MLIFDEVISGFRIGKTGMAGRLGMRPDLVTFGKVIGGGFPVGAYAGRQDLMERVAPAGNVYQAGTLSANPVGMRAGLAAWGRLIASTAGTSSKRATEQLLRGSSAMASPIWSRRSTSSAQGSIFWIPPVAGQPDSPARRDSRGQQRMVLAVLSRRHQRGVYLPPSSYEVGFVSLAHDDGVLSPRRRRWLLPHDEVDTA